jgi:hypothetical protein
MTYIMFWPVVIVGTLGALLSMLGLRKIGDYLMDISIEWEERYS